MFLRVLLGLWLLGAGALAQTVQPVIVEYKERAEGKFAVTNNTLAPMVVVVEPRSFSITPEGKGVFRKLDPEIHVELSATSARLEPQQTRYFFYKARADRLPAWFTVYATFSSARHTSGLDVRFMLPHTVYLYQKKPLMEDAVEVKQAAYLRKSQKVVCEVVNEGAALGRVQEVTAIGGRASSAAAGFPLLPGSTRRLEIDWKEKEPPTAIALRFERFTLRRPLSVRDEDP